MLSVIIVDDEPAICDLIRNLVEWESLDMYPAGIAYDGDQAYHMICTQNPDIVVTDIRMPGLDGLDFISKVREKNQDIAFIIISGYEEFKYAQKALQLNVEDYLLKPINKHELNQLLLRIKAAKEREKQRELDLLQATGNRDTIRKQWIKMFINQPGVILDSSLEEANAKFYFHFQQGYFFACMLKIDFKNDYQVTLEDKDHLIIKIGGIIGAQLAGNCADMEIFSDNDLLYLIVNYTNAEEGTTPQLRKMFAGLMETLLKKYNWIRMTCAIGRRVSEWSDLGKSFEDLQNLIYMRIWYGSDSIFDAESQGVNFSKRIRLPAFEQDNLFRIVDTFQSNDLSHWAEETMAKYLKDFIYPPVGIIHLAIEICNLVDGRLEKSGFLPELNPFEDTIKECLSYSEFLDRFRFYLSERMKKSAEVQNSRNSKSIRAAVKYIEDNFQKQITLDELAEVVHLNPVYLSALFKKETDRTLTDYIIDIRIQHAKELLRTTFLSVQEIVDKIGYKDNRYFSRLFRKNVGIYPTEYRKYHS